ISWQYPVVETTTALLFVGSYLYWPLSLNAQGLTVFVFWLLFLTGFMALLVYDFKWMLLPDKLVYPLLGLALLQTVAISVVFHGGLDSLLGAFWGFLIIGGLFYVLFQVSNGKWIGGGDVKLGMVLGILAGGPIKAILLLFMASLSGAVISLLLIASKRLKPNHHIPFGPFLILAAIITQLWGTKLVDLYQRLFL
ncbi:MAG: putative Prepilin peptidase, partial [Candidatus Saccharibacteria bacterium]|nr:putative Prepilin peptidase [Candidatus Saccharibacteria bacterium]